MLSLRPNKHTMTDILGKKWPYFGCEMCCTSCFSEIWRTLCSVFGAVRGIILPTSISQKRACLLFQLTKWGVSEWVKCHFVVNRSPKLALDLSDCLPISLSLFGVCWTNSLPLFTFQTVKISRLGVNEKKKLSDFDDEFTKQTQMQ